MKVLMIEDDLAICELLTQFLINHRYSVDVATDGQTGLDLAIQFTYDIILLDVLIPGLDGISICRQLRKQEYTTPILMLTAKDSDEDIITGLNAGADDYVIKPCSPSHLLARMGALLRRQGRDIATVLTWGELSLNLAMIQVTYAGIVVALSPKEYALLELFLRNPQRIFSRDAIIDHLWSVDGFPSLGAVTNLIKDLRRKLKTAGMTDELIETVHRLGYRLNPPPKQRHDNGKAEPTGENRAATTQQQQELGLREIAEAAESFKAVAWQRLTALEQAVRSLAAGDLSREEQQHMQQEAHRLVGGLGTFGCERGSGIARSLEEQFSQDNLGPQHLDCLMQLLTELRQELQQTLGLSPSSTPQVSIPSTPIAHIWVVDEPLPFTALLRQNPLLQRVHIESVTREVIVNSPPLQAVPELVLLRFDRAFADTADVSLQQLRSRSPHSTIVALLEEDGLEERLASVRFGYDRCLVRSASSDAMAQTLLSILFQEQMADAKVMIVDDDPIMIDTLTSLLHPWGLYIIGLSEPEHFWQVLTSTNPDLLLLDIQMPGVSGIELCRIVRQDPHYGNLPILFVTARTDRESVQQVFAAGGDDFICKPIVAPELVTRVMNRLERTRGQLLRSHSERREPHNAPPVDPVTQLMNRQQFEEMFVQTWERSLQTQNPIGLMLCSVRQLHPSIHHGGHLPDDACLQSIVAILKSSCTASDLMARYGETEFAILLINADLNDTWHQVKRIHQRICRLPLSSILPAANARRSLSSLSPLSVHIGATGTLPSNSTATQSFITTALTALQTAQQQGQNSFCVLG